MLVWDPELQKRGHPQDPGSSSILTTSSLNFEVCSVVENREPLAGAVRFGSQTPDVLHCLMLGSWRRFLHCPGSFHQRVAFRAMILKGRF